LREDEKYQEISLKSRPEELSDPKKFDSLMENINTKLAIAAVALRESTYVAGSFK
jgi:hypothetical protein